jgi:hypothetical protein
MKNMYYSKTNGTDEHHSKQTIKTTFIKKRVLLTVIQ